MVFTGGIHGSSGVNNIAGSTACQIPGEKQLEHSSGKNARISSSQSFAADSVSLPSLEHSGGACPHSARQFVGLLCSTYLCFRKKHNRAKPMSELLSALISIADSSEFRFARFNIVYEGTQLVLPESPPIVSGVSDMRPPGVQTWKRHGIRCSHPAGRNTHIFLQ